MAGVKGGSGNVPKKKGGAVYPRINLEEAIQFSRKLVSKTHSAPQPYSTIFPGVFGVKPTNTQGQVRASALKQYGLLEGKPEAYTATALAKKIASATPEEIYPLYEQACLKPKIFRVLFDTFHDDTVSTAKLKQQAASAGAHPDQAEDCGKLFAEAAVFSKLAERDGESIKIGSVSGSVAVTIGEESEGPEAVEDSLLLPSDEIPIEKNYQGNPNAADTEISRGMASGSCRSVIHVNVTIDSTLDTEKLERQLALLRKYGAL
jgi:hypothetical protein